MFSFPVGSRDQTIVEFKVFDVCIMLFSKSFCNVFVNCI